MKKFPSKMGLSQNDETIEERQPQRCFGKRAGKRKGGLKRVYEAEHPRGSSNKEYGESEFGFMVQLEDVKGKTEAEPLNRDIEFTLGQETEVDGSGKQCAGIYPALTCWWLSAPNPP